MSYTKSYIVTLFWDGVLTEAYVTGRNKRVALRNFIIHVKPEWLDDFSEIMKTHEREYKLHLSSPTGVRMYATFDIRRINTGSDFIMLTMRNMHKNDE